ncbi:MAG: hypothetical protein ISN26_05390, partial [Betaproteobacteria bacterium AqS2]|nr:hypothetical protein [Betaproteobacteria bacterium AqS2]
MKEIEAATAPMPTGIAFHRSTASCHRISVGLMPGTPAYLQLAMFRSMDDQAVTTPSMADVNMAGDLSPSDRYVGIMLKERSEPPMGVMMVTLEARPHGSCDPEIAPLPLTMAYRLMIGNDPELGLKLGGSLAGMVDLGVMEAILARPQAEETDAAAALQQLVMAKQQQIEDGDIDLREFLTGQSFAIGLDPEGGRDRLHDLSFWGQGEAYGLEGATARGTTYDGEVFNARFGVDAWFGDSLLLGVGYSAHELKADFVDGGQEGSYSIEIGAAHPYVATQFDSGLLALAAGRGGGEVIIDSDDGDGELRRDADYVGYALGYRRDLNAALHVRVLAANGDIEVEEEEGEPAMDSSAGAMRLALSYEHHGALIADTPLRPGVELAYADTWGDGAQEKGSLVLAAIVQTDPANPVRVRVIYRHAAAEEHASGAEIDVRAAPGRGGLGLGFGFSPSWGLATTPDELLADTAVQMMLRPPETSVNELRAQADLSYGLAVADGLLTPYGSWALDGGSALGLRLRAAG